MLILQNQNYTGDLVQNKTSTISITTEKEERMQKRIGLL